MSLKKGSYVAIYWENKLKYGIVTMVGRKWLSVSVGRTKRIYRVLLSDTKAYYNLDN